MNSALSGILRQLSARRAIEQAHAARDGELRHERGQAAVRLVITIGVFAYLAASGLPFTFDLWPPSWLVFTTGFAALSTAFLAFAFRAPEPSGVRRLVMTAVDVAAISYLMTVTGEVGVPLFALYLWITVAMGLRFGPGAVTASAVLSLVGFAAVVSVAPVWQELGSVSVAVFVSLAVLSAFIAGLVREDTESGWARVANVRSGEGLRHGETTAVEQSGAQASDKRNSGVLARMRPNRNDELGREQAQSIFRLVNALLALGYLLVAYYAIERRSGYPDWLAPALGFIALSLAVLALTLCDTRASSARRSMMNVIDVFVVSYFMVATGKIGIPLFVFFLSITLGNGLRFGRRAMAVSAVLCIGGFSAVLALTPIWKELAAVAFAVMVVLALLPFSASLRTYTNTNGKGHDTRHTLSTVGPVSRFRAFYRQFFDRISKRADPRKRVDELGREQGQATVRLFNGALAFGYLLIAEHPVDLGAGMPDWFLFLIGFITFAVLLIVITRGATRSSTARRMVGNLADVTAISYVMMTTGTAGIPLFILYLSTTLGNGFRFGLAAMKASAVLSLVGFLAVIALSPVWQELPITVPIGVFLALVLLPAYASHLIRQLASATKRAEEASTAKSHFIARMSHELRTPLTGILGTAELLETNKRLTREDRSLLRVIKDSVKVSMRQIDNVLDFSKIEAGKLAIEQVDFDLHEVLNRATRLVRAVALEKGLRLMLRVDPAVPYDFVGDPHHLNEVLLNLLSNGIKFTERGYVSLEARLMEADERSALVRFEVHDTGIGMEPAASARIFDAFSQADTSTTRRYGGTGLGTTIAKQLVELMGGRLRVESLRGKGTVFSADLRFPRQGEPDAGGDAIVGGPMAGARVLLVSNDPALADRFATCVKEWGVAASAVASVSEAVGFLGRGIRLGNPVHAVLADARCVFDASGAHAAEDFTEKAALSATPVFLVCDVSPGAAQLRRWGYAGALSYDAPPALLFSALHSSYTVEALDERGVVQVEPWAWGQAGRAKPRVLVADDNRTNLMILRKILERANYDVDTADNGNKALDMLQRHRYKVAVLDMHMPGRDGVDVMREYRFSRHGARTPIVMLTANATMDAKVESADAGADAYLTKPATAGDVLSIIKKVLDDSEVYELRLGGTSRALSPPDVPLLNTEVISDLDRLYGDPGDMNSLLDTFESDSRRLLRELKTAIEAKDQPRFRDLVHALKGNAANIGALRLVHECYEAEHLGALDIYRDGRKLLEQFESLLLETLQALRELSGSGGDLLPQSSPGSPVDPNRL